MSIAALASAALALGGCAVYGTAGTGYPRGYYGYGGGIGYGYGAGYGYGGGRYYSAYPHSHYYYGAPRVQRYHPYVQQAPPAYRPYVAPPAYRR